jgi:hypothetical protein
MGNVFTVSVPVSVFPIGFWGRSMINRSLDRIPSDVWTRIRPIVNADRCLMNAVPYSANTDDTRRR